MTSKKISMGSVDFMRIGSLDLSINIKTSYWVFLICDKVKNIDNFNSIINYSNSPLNIILPTTFLNY